MAGVYPDAPGRRLAYDADGTTVLLSTASQNNSSMSYATLSPLDGTSKAKANDEYAAYGIWFGTYYATLDTKWGRIDTALLFPEKRDLDGVYIAGLNEWGGGTFYGHLRSSQDTTTGHDGAWTVANVPVTQSGGYSMDWPVGEYRDNITALAVSGATGATFVHRSNYGAVNRQVYALSAHLYGVIAAGETPDRILFLDTLNADAVFTKVLDYGDVLRGATQTRTIKLKNNSATKAINTIQITGEDLYLNAGNWYTFSDDDVSYQATLAVGNILATATQTIYVRQTIPAAETLGPQTGRLKVSHATVT